MLPQEVVTVRNRTEDLRARVQAIESLFATPPLGDVAEQRRRSKLIRYFVSSLSTTVAEFPSAISSPPKIDCQLGLRRLGHSDLLILLMTMEKLPDSSKIYGRSSLITRFVRNPGIPVGIYGNNRRCDKTKSMGENSN